MYQGKRFVQLAESVDSYKSTASNFLAKSYTLMGSRKVIHGEKIGDLFKEHLKKRIDVNGSENREQWEAEQTRATATRLLTIIHRAMGAAITHGRGANQPTFLATTLPALHRDIPHTIQPFRDQVMRITETLNIKDPVQAANMADIAITHQKRISVIRMQGVLDLQALIVFLTDQMLVDIERTAMRTVGALMSTPARTVKKNLIALFRIVEKIRRVMTPHRVCLVSKTRQQHS